MISSILIANRGEIALRIVRTCRRLGIRPLGVFSEADRNAPHVSACDAAMLIGPAEAHASYLNVEAIIDAAKRLDAEAIHPGYGFLAESPELAEACGRHGLVFIGPSPNCIKKMGSKVEAKKVAALAGVPCVPGYAGEDQSAGRLRQAAEEIGMPVLIKASAGGGGKGMRRVGKPGGF